MNRKLKIILITLLTVIQSAAFGIVFTTIQPGGNSSKDLIVQVGKQYQLKFDLQHQTTIAVRIQLVEGSIAIVDETNLIDGTDTFLFTPNSNTVTLKFIREDNDNTTRDFEVDNLIYEEIVSTVQTESYHEIGRKEYELADHLGNVRVVMSDKEVNGNVEVITATDYLPFGMIARAYTNGILIRNGYNGKETENIVSEGDYDFGARIYDSRTGRWLSMDFFAKKFIHQSPYVFADGNPIAFFDAAGDSSVYVNNQGAIIYVSHDKLENMIVVVDQENIESFHKMVAAFVTNNIPPDDARANKWLRLTGTCYAVDGFKKFYANNNQRNKTGYGLEHKSFLYIDYSSAGDNVVRIGKENLKGTYDRVAESSPDVNTGSTTGAINSGSVGSVHTHPNSGLLGDNFQTYEDEPSNDDMKNKTNGYADIVISPKKIYLYNLTGTTKTISLDKNNLFDKSKVVK